MKILLVARNFDKHGGIPKYTVELAERFCSNHEVHLLTSNYDYEIPKLIVHRKPMIKRPFWLQILSNAYYNTKYIKKLDKKHNFDIVHTQGSGAFTCDIVTAHSCHRAALKKVNEFDREELPFYKYFLHKAYRFLKPTNRIVLLIEKRVLTRGSKKVISVAKGVKKEIEKNYSVPSNKIETIPPGVDLEGFKVPSKESERIKEKYNISDNKFVIFFCAHEFRRKGLAIIIKALPRIKADVTLLVAGKDNPAPYRKMAKKFKVREQIIFVGNIKKNINHYYSASDVFIFPTKYEAFPAVILEAAASGLPLITMKVNGTREFVEDGENGFFVKRNPEDIAEKINKIICNKELRIKMQEEVKKTVQKYSWGSVIKEIEQAYKKVLREKRLSQ